MKRLLFALACCAAARTAVAQMMVVPMAQTTEQPAYLPQDVEVKGDGRCMTVHPGDVVHYTLTIQGVAAAPNVFGDLRLRLGRSKELMRGDLPVPDFRSLGGGGQGMRDDGAANMYHFTFTVPQEIYGGTYRGTDVYVRADRPETTYTPVGLHEHAPHIEVTRHTRDEIHAYCLNVISNFGAQTRPAVTDFQPGSVDPASTPPPPAQPQPLSQTLPPASPQPLMPPR